MKTDRRDARTLCDACRLGAYRAVHRASDAQRHVRAELAVRDALVRTRTRYVALIKALVRRDGLRLTQGEPERTVAKVAALALPPALAAELTPLLALLEPLNQQIAAADQRLTVLAATDPVVQRLTSAPGIGPVTATAFVATLDDITRFATAHQVEAYLGLVPSERSSGERQHRGRITKQGNTRMRWLLVEAGWRVLRSPRPEAAGLKAWAERIAVRQARRGRRLGPTTRRGALRHVARWDHVLRGAPASPGGSRRGGIGTAGLDREVTDPGRASAMQLMAAGEAVNQFWRHPPHRISPCAGEYARHREREQKRERHLADETRTAEGTSGRSRTSACLTLRAASQKLQTT